MEKIARNKEEIKKIGNVLNDDNNVPKRKQKAPKQITKSK